MAFFHRLLEERWLFYIGLFGLAVGLPLSRSFVSIAPGVLLGAWLFDGIYRKDLSVKWKSFTSDRTALWLSVIFLLYALSGLWSTNGSVALKLIIDKLPLLLLPLVFTGMPRPSEKTVFRLWVIHLVALLVSTVLSYLNSWNISQIGDPKGAILFVNHIRLSLMVTLALIFLFRRQRPFSKIPIILAIAIAGWFIFFLAHFQLATGLGLVLIIALVAGFRSIRFKGSKRWLGLASLGIFLAGAGYVFSVASEQFRKPHFEKNQLEMRTSQGSLYYHMPHNLQTENGHYVWHYISLDELRQSWNERSEISIEEDHGLENYFVGRLMRYLTSKGLRKDSEGVMALNEADVRNIESGYHSILELNQNKVEQRIRMLSFEIDSYRYGGDPSLSSLAVKLEYWKTGLSIFKDNLWTGVGIGDVKDSYWMEYAQGTDLKEDAWDKSHQQYLTWFITFGMIGGLLVLFAFIRPILFEQFGAMSFPVLLIYGVFLISFIVEDTLETQLGINLFLFYLGLFILPSIQTSNSSP